MSSPNLLYNHAGRFLPKKRNHIKKSISVNENTQTSKTILQLADFELQNGRSTNKNMEFEMSNEIGDHETRKLRFDRKNNVIAAVQKSNENLCKNTKENFVVQWKKVPTTGGGQGQTEQKNTCFISPDKWSRFSVKEIRIKSFNVDEPPECRDKSTTSLNGDNKSANSNSQYEARNSDESSESFTTATTIDSRRRARSLSPPPTHRSLEDTFTTNATNATVDDVDDEEEEEDDAATIKTYETNKSRDKFNVLMLQVKSSNWNVSLKAMSEIAEILENVEYERLYSSMPELNQRLIAFLRSPRSHVCRTACQIAGRFFAIVKDTRRPEFDAIVDLLLLRTADANKFIRNDANLALDTLIIHIPPFHTIRVISQKAPSHKNDLVRITSARLMVCIVGLAGADLFLSPPANEASRKRLIQLMAKFVLDKNGKTREYGARLYVALFKHPHFELHLKKIVNKVSINEMKKIMKNVNLE